MRWSCWPKVMNCSCPVTSTQICQRPSRCSAAIRLPPSSTIDARGAFWGGAGGGSATRTTGDGVGAGAGADLWTGRAGEGGGGAGCAEASRRARTASPNARYTSFSSRSGWASRRLISAARSASTLCDPFATLFHAQNQSTAQPTRGAVTQATQGGAVGFIDIWGCRDEVRRRKVRQRLRLGATSAERSTSIVGSSSLGSTANMAVMS